MCLSFFEHQISVIYRSVLPSFVYVWSCFWLIVVSCNSKFIALQGFYVSQRLFRHWTQCMPEMWLCTEDNLCERFIYIDWLSLAIRWICSCMFDYCANALREVFGLSNNQQIGLRSHDIVQSVWWEVFGLSTHQPVGLWSRDIVQVFC